MRFEFGTRILRVIHGRDARATSAIHGMTPVNGVSTIRVSGWGKVVPPAYAVMTSAPRDNLVLTAA